MITPRRVLAPAFLALSMVVAFVLVSASSAWAGPVGDYGDAPDNTGGLFPSLYNTTNARVPGRRGPFVTNTSPAFLCWDQIIPQYLCTSSEIDARLTDADYDDCEPIYGYDPGTGQGVLWVRVFASSVGAPANPYYLNVAIDYNRDGEWKKVGPTDEWVGVNVPVNLIQGQGLTVGIPVSVASSDKMWTRVALTDTQINPADFGADGWDGSGPGGGFARGEIEDWYTAPDWDPGSPPGPPPGRPHVPVPASSTWSILVLGAVGTALGLGYLRSRRAPASGDRSSR